MMLFDELVSSSIMYVWGRTVGMEKEKQNINYAREIYKVLSRSGL